jgi:RHS repeat-associated protein
MCQVDNGSIIADVTDYGLTKYVRGVTLLYSETTSGERSYYLYNAHGDVVQLTDEYGNIARTYDYDAFGVEREPDEDDTNLFRYCGEYWDAETSTYYLRARNYDPSTGRFTSEDPIRDGLNWYTYCAGNPIFFVDPSGLAVTAWDMQNLSPSQVAELANLTDQWNNATSQAQRDAAHAQANAIRQSAGTGVTFNANSTANAYGGDAVVFYGAVTGGSSMRSGNAGAAIGASGAASPVQGYANYEYDLEQINKVLTSWLYKLTWDGQFFSMNYFDALRDLLSPDWDTTGWGRSISEGSLPIGKTPVNSVGKGYTNNQQAVIELAKEAKKSGRLSENEADILIGYAQEYGVPYHPIEVHPNRPGAASYRKHIHIGRTGHIPILP